MHGVITGIFDHVQFSAICCYSSRNLKIDCRMGRCGMYYAGTDLQLYDFSKMNSNQRFEMLKKGVFVAIKSATNAHIKISSSYNSSVDNGNIYMLPTLLAYFNYLNCSIFESQLDNTYNENVAVIAVNGASTNNTIITCSGVYKTNGGMDMKLYPKYIEQS